MIYDDLWWFMMIHDDLWLFIMIYDDLWLFIMIYDDLWLFIMETSYGKKPGRKGMAIAISKVFPNKCHTTHSSCRPGNFSFLQPRSSGFAEGAGTETIGPVLSCTASAGQTFYKSWYSQAAQDSSRSGGLVPNPSFIIMLPIWMAIDWHSMPNV